ncbi:hypothetical protein BDR26DRAFT_1012037 [Obelidium mucronatum]|nr:hypothetical protein BDR26DRAFT_1012037 [Obelidium mucronatum]
MDQLFEVAAYTEDQKNSHLILHVHVAHRAVNALSAVTTLGLMARSVLGGKKTVPLMASVLRGNAVAVLLGVAGSAAMVEMKMQDKQPIEWQDRSWRLLNNKLQNQIDVWSAGGALTGMALFGLRAGAKGHGGAFVRAVGGAGLGSIVGIAAFGAFTKAEEFGYIAELKKQVNELRSK